MTLVDEMYERSDRLASLLHRIRTTPHTELWPENSGELVEMLAAEEAVMRRWQSPLVGRTWASLERAFAAELAEDADLYPEWVEATSMEAEARHPHDVLLDLYAQVRGRPASIYTAGGVA